MSDNEQHDKDCPAYHTELGARCDCGLQYRARITELVKALDDQMGTPCEQIRHQQEVVKLQTHINELEEFRDYANKEYKKMQARVNELEAEQEPKE